MENKKYNNEEIFTNKEINKIDNSLEDIERSIIKQNVINELNSSFRTVLSYGTANELIPNGQFIVKDIVRDETTNSQNLILEQVDNSSINLIVPRSVFVQFVEMAIKNSKNLNISEGNPVYSANTIEESAALKVLLDKTLTDLQKAQVIPLEENGIVLLRDGKEETANYSVCPIYTEPLQRYLEKERIPEQNPPKPDSENTLQKLTIPNQLLNIKEKEEKEPEIPDIIIEPGPKTPEIEIEMDM